MSFSVFDIFKMGIGPSSSHTMGPMLAAGSFAARLVEAGQAQDIYRLKAELYGSLALTGRGHATDRAVILGFMGFAPASLDLDAAAAALERLAASGELRLPDGGSVDFDQARDIAFLSRERMPFHANALRCKAFDRHGAELASQLYYSIGGGAVVEEGRLANAASLVPMPDPVFPFSTAAELLDQANMAGLSIAELALANEAVALPEGEIRDRLAAIVGAMNACIDRGMAAQGELPGGLRVRRRAASLHARLLAGTSEDPLAVLDWVNLWALAVSEENAAGGRVVTAPTNGAAGIVPAVLRYYQDCIPGASSDGAVAFLLVAGVIGSLFKENASISGAEVGCQGEVGVACSMAAAGLAAVLGGSNAQVENAAEIAMEHNLGLTCDPISGLVQVPCIERNAIGAVKAIEAARLALHGDGSHRVSLDQVIRTMLLTGRDMNERYKETSLGGLALNVVEC